MQIFFAVSCLLAVLALTNGASVAPKSEQPRAEVEAQVVETAGETRAAEAQATEQVAETAGETRADKLAEKVAAEIKNIETAGIISRIPRTLRRLRLACSHRRHGLHGCSGSGCSVPEASGCAGDACPSTGCGGAVPCRSNTVVVRQDVPVAQPVPVHVPVVQVVHQDVPVPQPVPVPVVKVVRVPVPVDSPRRPCCGQLILPRCTPCSG